MQHPQHRRCSPGGGLYLCRIFFEERDQALRCVNGAARSRGDALEEEVEPRFPIAGGSNVIQKPVVLVSVLLEIQAQIEQRLLQDRMPLMAETLTA